MKRRLIVLMMALGLPIGASATDWYMMNVSQEVCVSAAKFAVENHTPEYASPYLQREFARKYIQTYLGTKVVPLWPGMGRMVEIKFSPGRALYYFSSLKGCQKAIQISIDNGSVPNLNELK